MNPTDYYEIHMELVNAIGNVWEIWLTITFATVVAFHIGRNSINGVLLLIGTLLYIAAALVAVTRYLNYADSIRLLREEALTSGLTAFPQNLDMAAFITVLPIGTMVMGTIATATFVIYQYRRRSSE